MSETTPSSGRLAAEISNAVVHAIALATGRGPTKARTTIGRDAIFVVVEDALTPGERTLVEAGDEESVMRIRAAWQQAMRTTLSGHIERLTGRRVIAFMSSNHVEPDLGVEVFILEAAEGHDGRIAEGDTSA
jgi:uncharacterized protein YbcI